VARRNLTPEDRERFVVEARRNPTEAESLLLKALRQSPISDRTIFQHNLQNYIVDVNIHPNLVVEVDGGYHEGVSQRVKDKLREIHLELGSAVHFLRFTNMEVETAPDVVVAIICAKAALLNPRIPMDPLG